MQEKYAGNQSQDKRAVVEIKGDLVDQILEQVEDDDHIILTTMGSLERFGRDEQQIPAELADRFSGSLSILHYP